MRLPRLVAEWVRLTGAKNGAGASVPAKVMSIVAGMAAGADSIDDLDVLRHGAMPALFGGIRAPSTLGTFLRPIRRGVPHGCPSGSSPLPWPSPRFRRARLGKAPVDRGAGAHRQVVPVDVRIQQHRAGFALRRGAHVLVERGGEVRGEPYRVPVLACRRCSGFVSQGAGPGAGR